MTFEAFVEYYRDVNATLPIDKDGYFIEMVTRTWNLYDSPQHTAPQCGDKLEALLYEKIRQRTGSKEDEGKVLGRAIAYVDVANTHTLTPPQFTQLLTNIGCVLPPDDIRTLFSRLDPDHSNKLCSEWLANRFALRGAGSNPNAKPKFSTEPDPPTRVLETIKKTLKQHGIFGVRELSRLFRRMDVSGDQCIDRHEFVWAMKENGHRLSELEYERLFRYLDRNNDGVVDYVELLQGLRGPLPEPRRLAIHDLYHKLETSCSGHVTLPVLASMYNAARDPRVPSSALTLVGRSGEDEGEGCGGRVPGAVGHIEEGPNGSTR